MEITGFKVCRFIVQSPKGFTEEFIEYSPVFCKKLLDDAKMMYDSVFIEEYMDKQFLDHLPILN